MPTWPDGVTLVTIRHTPVTTGGRTYRGLVTARASERLFEADRTTGGDSSILPADASTSIEPDGSWEIQLPAVDAGILPEGAAFWLVEHVTGAEGKGVWVAPMSHHAPGPVGLADVLTPQPTPGGGITIQTGPATDPSMAEIADDPDSEFRAVLDDAVTPTATAAGTQAAIDTLADQPAVTEAAAERAVTVAADPTVAALAQDDNSQFRKALTTSGRRPVGQGELVVSLADVATGDGIADDTAAIQAAIDTAPAGARIVGTPGAVYRTTGVRITDKAGLVLDGQGATVHLTATGASANVGAFEVRGTNSDVTIQGWRVVGSGIAADKHVGILGRAGHNHHGISVVGNSIEDVAIGISFTAGAPGSISGLLYQGNTIRNAVGTAPGEGYGLHVSSDDESDPTGTRIIGNYIEGAQRHSIYQASGRGVVISGNVVARHRAGLGGTHLAAINVLRSSGVTVSGNTVIGATGGTLRVSADTKACSLVTITGNVLADPTDNLPVLFVGDDAPAFTLGDVTITGNVLRTTTTARLVVVASGLGVNISGNTLRLTAASNGNAMEFRAAGDSAGTASWTDSINVAGNIITMSGAAGHRPFRLAGLGTSTAQAAFIGNQITGVAGEFIYSNQLTNPNITVGGQGTAGLTYATGHAPLVLPRPVTRAAAPPAATGSDAATINSLIDTLKAQGILT